MCLNVHTLKSLTYVKIQLVVGTEMRADMHLYIWKHKKISATHLLGKRNRICLRSTFMVLLVDVFNEFTNRHLNNM